MSKILFLFLLCTNLFAADTPYFDKVENTTECRQPLLLLYQRQKDTPSWSLCVCTDKADHHKITRLTLDEILPSEPGYKSSLKHHLDPHCSRSLVAQIKAEEFGKTGIATDNNLLSVNVIPAADNSGYRIDVTARTSVDGYIAIGPGKGSVGNVYLKFDKEKNAWALVSGGLQGIDGTRFEKDTVLSGIAFLNGMTCVSLIIAVDPTEKILTTLLDRK